MCLYRCFEKYCYKEERADWSKEPRERMHSLAECSGVVTLVVFTFVCAGTWAAPNPEREGIPSVGSSFGVRRALDLGLGVAKNLNLKFLKGISGTQLGIEGPSNFRLQLEKKTPFGVLHDLYSRSKQAPSP